MAIDLPPVIPPQASTAERIVQYSSAREDAVYEAEVAGYTLRITGNRHLSKEQLDMLMAAAKTPAQAVNALNQSYHHLGHLLTTIYFAQRDETIFVHVINGTLADIKAPEGIKEHFSSLIGDSDLHRSEFDTKRVLANLKSDRAGLDYEISYQVSGDPNALTMVFSEREQADHDATVLSLSANNYGNRFLGRYFGGVSAKHDFTNGLHLQFVYDRALTEFGEVNGGDYYDGYTFRLNYPSQWGLYGIEARHVEYARFADALVTTANDPLLSLGTCDIALLCALLGGTGTSINIGGGGTTTRSEEVYLEHRTQSAALTGEQVLMSDSLYRLTLTERVEYIDSTIDLRDGGALLDEPQTNLELGLKFNRLLRIAGFPSRLTAQAFVDFGLKSDSGTFATDDRQGVVFIGRRTSEFTIFKPRFSLQSAVVDWANLTASFTGQYSDGSQLPLQQQYYLGGSNGLAAYLPGVLVGDSGHYAKLSFESNPLPFMGLEIKPSVFIEQGWVWYEDARGDAGDTRMISDAGFALKASYKDYLSSEFVVAHPIDDENINQSLLDAAEVDFFWRLKVSY